MIAQVTAVVLGTLVATSEYGTGMIRATLAAVPRRGAGAGGQGRRPHRTLLVVGTVTAFAGYLGGNAFLAARGIGVPLDGDGVLRALFGSGLYLAGLGLLSMAVGLLVRHTAAALSTVLGVVFVVGNMAFLLPGDAGASGWRRCCRATRVGGATPVSFNPDAAGPVAGLRGLRRRGGGAARGGDRDLPAPGRLTAGPAVGQWTDDRSRGPHRRPRPRRRAAPPSWPRTSRQPRPSSRS